MATPEIIPRAVFGLRTDVKQNAHYISDFQILYPVGSVLILQNYYEKRQKYIKLFEKSCFLDMVVVSPSRKLAAIILNGERGQIFVFDMETLKKRRTLNLPPDSTTNRFETIAFSHDDTYIMAITGSPDWNLVTYRWAKGKVTSNVKAVTSSSPIIAIQIACSPAGGSELCVFGHGLFRLLTMTESVWRQYGFQKADQIVITSAVWIRGNKIICGTSDAKLFFVENGELKGVYNALTSTMLGEKEKDDTTTAASSSLLAIRTASDVGEGEDIAVRTLISFSKGLAYSCRSGFVHMFEKESQNRFKKRNLFKICDTALGALDEVELNVVHHLSINVSQDRLLATTKRAQIYTVRLWGPDINVAPEIPFKHLGEPLHFGRIIDLTVCIWKPIFVTVGATDQTVRLWNYKNENIEIVKQYQREILCLDLHPTGNFLAIGFTDEVDVSVILMNDIQSFMHLPLLNCERCRFNDHGNYLAAVNQGVIEVYGIIMMSKVFSLKGHTGNINAMNWVWNDRQIASCSSEGEIFFWDAVGGTLSRELRTPGVSYLDIAVPSDGKFVYAVGNDGLLREINDDYISRVFKVSQSALQNIVLSRSNLMMFLTGDTSDVLSVKVPLTNPPEYSAFHYHSTNITQIRVSYDDQTLITVSNGGTVIIWKLNFAEGKTIAMEKDFIHSVEILINKGELEKKIMTIKDLSQKLYELELEKAKDMRDTENIYCEKIRDIHETFTATIEELKEKIDQVETHQNSQLTAIKQEIDELRSTQAKEKSDMIKNYTNKLLVEYQKVRSLADVRDQTINDYENRLTALEQSKEEGTNDIIKFYKGRLEEVNNLLQETYEENVKNLEEHEIIKQQLGDDADREIVETKAKYEGILKDEKELFIVLRDEAVHMRKKFTEAQKERDEFRAKAQVLQNEKQKYQANLSGLEKDITDLKAEILERDTAIEDKDERIFLLKKRIQELDKFKFVLDYKIKELKKQIDPKDREIRERKDQIEDMEVELENLRQINSSLELQLKELKDKIVGTEKEIGEFEKKQQNAVNSLRQIKIDIYSLYQELSNFKNLKDGIKVLYQKYSSDEVGFKEAYPESDVLRELMVQREFLEKTITALRSTLEKNQRRQTDGSKVVRDNAKLLEELNTIRKDLKLANISVRKMEKLLGIRGDAPAISSEVFNRLQQALKKQDNIKQMYQEVINEANQETAEVQKKVKKMQEKVCLLIKTEQEKGPLDLTHT